MKKSRILLIIFLVIAAAATIIFELPGVVLTADETKNILLKELFSRIILAAFVIFLVVYGRFNSLKIERNNLGKHLLFIIPCLLVALANFPFSALISGSAVIERVDLIYILVINCVLIAIIEDFFFQGILRSVIDDYFKNTSHRIFISILVTAIVFALSHLLNLLSGAAIGATLLQVGYTFLIGAMFSTIKTKTNNIYLIVVLHSIFDIGGTIVTKLGNGVFQDKIFWILTISFGIIAGIYILVNIIIMDRKDTLDLHKSQETTEIIN
ncbi:CPBP family intramembrane metalloprotease [bacterium]|nr:CPBP family intramembrane metalloprotease [bacterium]